MNIVYISTYPPIRCGIGTYTHFLSQALSRINKELRISIVAENGAKKIKDKLFETSPCFNRQEDYVQRINEATTEFCPDIVHIQHEFAVFNPDERFLNLLQELKNKAKIVLTLHTVHTNETNDWNIEAMSIEEYNFRMSQLVDVIIVHQVSMKEELVRQNVNEKLIHVIQQSTSVTITLVDSFLNDLLEQYYWSWYFYHKLLRHRPFLVVFLLLPHHSQMTVSHIPCRFHHE